MSYNVSGKPKIRESLVVSPKSRKVCISCRPGKGSSSLFKPLLYFVLYRKLEPKPKSRRENMNREEPQIHHKDTQFCADKELQLLGKVLLVKLNFFFLMEYQNK